MGRDSSTLAARAGLAVNTIDAMEQRGPLLPASFDKVRAVMGFFEIEGLEFLNFGQPGGSFSRARVDPGKTHDELTSEKDG